MIESVEGRKEGYESDVEDGKCASVAIILTISWRKYMFGRNLTKFISIFLDILSESFEKDDTGTEEESNKEDAEYSMPIYDR